MNGEDEEAVCRNCDWYDPVYEWCNWHDDETEDDGNCLDWRSDYYDERR